MRMSISRHANLNRPDLIPVRFQHCKKHYSYLNSKKGMAARTLLSTLGLILIAIIAGISWHLSGKKNPPPLERAAIPDLYKINKPTPAKAPSPSSENADRTKQPGDADLRQVFQDLFQVERVHHSGDSKKKERDIARANYHRIKQLLKSLRKQGLEDGALYDEAESRLAETYGPPVLKMLEGYRLLEEELAEIDLDTMSPEERLEYTQKARRYAFGEEMADNLFFKQEAFARYKLEEKTILEDSSLSPEAQRETLAAQRKALQVDLATRGSYASFADERKENLEGKLQARYGDSLNTMTAEERKTAIREMYSEELPPEIMNSVDNILAAQAEKKALLKAYQQERDIIMNDPELSYAQKQEQLRGLKERFKTTN